MSPEAAALEVVAGAPVELAGAELARLVEPAGEVEVRVLVAGAEVVLPLAGAEVLPLALASVEVLARVNGMELGVVAVPVGVIPAMQQKNNG
jgi:hypothetical protein